MKLEEKASKHEKLQCISDEDEEYLGQDTSCGESQDDPGAFGQLTQYETNSTHLAECADQEGIKGHLSATFVEQHPNSFHIGSQRF